MRDCIVQRKARRVFRLSADLAVTMHQLRRDFRRCQTCDCAESCWIWNEFHTQVDRAIRQLNREWGLQE